jgi:hypothetical protein
MASRISVAKSRAICASSSQRATGFLELPGSQHDLDKGRQQSHALPGCRGGGEDAADAARCGLRLPLSQPQQHNPRLRLAPVLTSKPVRSFGFGHVAAQPQDLGPLVARFAEDLWIGVFERTTAESPQPLDRLGPGAAELYDLRAGGPDRCR